MPLLRSSPLVLVGGGNRLVLVKPRVLNTIPSGIDRRDGFRETGGILIGAYRGKHIEIDDCTSSLPMDLRTRTRFHRCDPGHQAAAMAAWVASHGTDTFVGEWHTHPEDFPRYSNIDRETWKALMQRSRDPIVLAIGGWREVWWGLGAESRILPLSAASE